MKPSRKQVLDAAARLSERDNGGVDSRYSTPGAYWSIALSGGFGAPERLRVLNDIRTLLDAAVEAPESFDAA